MPGKKELKERKRKGIATHRPGGSNKNSMSSPGIKSSYLYRVSTRASHVSRLKG